jgi:hypothetical protein
MLLTCTILEDIIGCNGVFVFASSIFLFTIFLFNIQFIREWSSWFVAVYFIRGYPSLMTCFVGLAS